MFEEDKLFNFMSGLQPWAQTKLRRQSIKDLSSTIVVADSLVDFKSTTRKGYASASFKSRAKDKEEEKKKKKKKFGGGALKSIVDKGKAKLMDTQGKSTKLNFTCFICDDPYFARECLKREKLKAIRVGDSDEDKGVVTHVNLMHVLNYLVAESGDVVVEISFVD
jgi:hypothetical protein